MIETTILLISGMIITIIIAVFLHELGHWIYWKTVINDQVEFSFKGFKVTGRYGDKLKKGDLFNFYFLGVTLGYVPIALTSLYGNYICVFLTGLYIIGCRSDLKEMWRVITHGDPS